MTSHTISFPHINFSGFFLISLRCLNLYSHFFTLYLICMWLLFIMPVIKLLFFTIVLPGDFVVARRAFWRETEMAILVARTNLPVWDFQKLASLIWTRTCIIWNSRTSLKSVRRCSNVRHWRSSNIPLTLLVLWWRFSVHRAARRWTISSWWMGFTSRGDHTAEAYSTCGRTRLLYSFSLMRGDRTLTFLLMNPSALLEREQVCAMCFVISWPMVIPGYFAVSVVFRSVVTVVEWITSISELGRMTFLGICLWLGTKQGGIAYLCPMPLPIRWACRGQFGVHESWSWWSVSSVAT